MQFFLAPLAEIPIEGILGILTGFGLVVVVPVVAIFTAHQRRMAQIVHNQPQQDLRTQQQLDLMQAQINDLRGQLHEHIVRTDSGPLPQPAPPPLHERLNG